MIQFDEDKQNRKISDLRKKDEENLAQILASKYGVEYIDLTPISINTDAVRLIPEEAARKAKAVAFALVDRKVKLASHSPNTEEVSLIIKNLENAGYSVEVYITTTSSLEKVWGMYKEISFASESKSGSLDISNAEIANLLEKNRSLDDVVTSINELISTNKSSRISKILETILAGAFSTEASDIHIEPEENYIHLRYRLDGVLVDVLNFDSSTYNLLLSRIKLLSGLKLNIHQEAQDGRFSVKLHDTDIEIRTSILPGAYNESIVLRILNPKSIAVPIEELGIPESLLDIIMQAISKPNGMLLTTGPTGSGKTTTLYALLKKIHNPGIKIITIEDPIEYHLPGIVQTQTNEKGYNFLEGLRSALRQDPDVIMVGEIRDSETASIAINSAQTGHLVFSTLHTNSAAGAFPRLIDLGINPQILTSAINLTLAQRLLRKLCEKCKKEIVLDENNKKKVNMVLDSIFNKSLIPKEQKVFAPTGCDDCHHTGYKGRVGIYEAILIDQSIEQIVRENPSEREIAKTAIPQGILTMRQDGMIKVLTGTTSLDELLRVINIEI